MPRLLLFLLTSVAMYAGSYATHSEAAAFIFGMLLGWLIIEIIELMYGLWRRLKNEIWG